ncbi:MAG: hypothetical protein C0594_02845 [Marinilabiliales bacterium]|nr:MAG: hypothetical protein C0594_02845 [Marinilabiliales bacterium]
MTKHLLLFILILLISANSFGQKKQKDKKYIEKTKYSFSFTPSYLNQSTTYKILDNNGIGESIVYRPNVLGAVTLGMRYSFIGLSYTFQLPMSSDLETNYGKSEYTNVSMVIQTRNVGFNLYFQKFKGMYRDINDGMFPKYDSQIPLTQRNDLQTFTVGYYNNFVFGRKFSMKAAFDQSEIQKKSAGSAMIMIADRFTRIQADSTIVPYDQVAAYTDMYGFYKGTFNSLIIAPGFGYSFVAGPFSFTPVVLMGSGLQIQSYRLKHPLGSKDSKKSGIKFPMYLNVKNAIGINTQSFYFRIVSGIDMNILPIKSDTKTSLTYLKAEVCMGVRF